MPPLSLKSLPTVNTHNTYAIRILKQVKFYDIYALFIIWTSNMIPFVYLYYTAKSAHICNKAVHTFTEQSK